MEDQEGSKKKSIEAVGIEEPKATAGENLSLLSIQELQTMLNNVLENEDYIKAIAIRDEIQKRK